MFLRIDKLPASPEVDPIAAKNVQELLGGRFGEMSTLMRQTARGCLRSAVSTSTGWRSAH
jgi:Mn-containing catalase